MFRQFHPVCNKFALRHFLRGAFTGDPLTESKGRYFYVIPEIPTDTPSSNPILNTAALPRFAEVNAEDIFTGVSKQIIEYQVGLSQMAECIRNKSIPLTYESIVTKLDEIIFPVQHSFQFIEGLQVTKNDPTCRVVISRLMSKYLQAQCEHLYSNSTIYCALHTVLLKLDQNDGLKRGVVEQLLAEGWSNGAAHSPTALGNSDSCASCGNPHFIHSSNKKQLQKVFTHLYYLRSELLKAENTFQLMVTNSAFVSSPESVSRAQSSGRYTGVSSISSNLPNYLANALNPEASGQIPVAESDLSASAPTWLPLALGGKQEGGYYKGMRVNISIDSTANLFLRHCSNREIRRLVWQALVQRAAVRTFGGSSGQHASNEERIEQIRRLRSQVARDMGVPDWLNLVWRRTASSGRGPRSPDALVDEVLEPLRQTLVPRGKLEWQILNEWAAPHLRISPQLEHHDIDYAIEQYNFTISLAPGSSPSTDPRYLRVLPLQATIDRIFSRLGDLFGLTVSPLSQNEGYANGLNIPSSIVYGVEDQRERVRLGEILVDLGPKYQSGVTSLDNVAAVPLTTRFPVAGRSPSPICADISIAGLFGNLSQEAARLGLSETEALNIAASVGSCLQHVVSRTPSYSFTGLSTPMPGVSLAGSTRGNPIRDDYFLTQDLIKLLLIRSSAMRRAVLGETPANTHDSTGSSGLKASHGVSQVVALPMLRTLYESRFDLELWGAGRSSWKHWQSLSDALWTTHLPYGRHPHDQWPCSALALFGPRGIPGMRYAEVWRQVVALDSVMAFSEAGFDEQWDSAKVRQVFRRFRECVLDPGTAISSRDVFQAFRGRDPLPDALLNTFETT